MSKTKIAWTEETLNPIRAKRKDGENRVPGHYCVKVGPGCKNCYASRMQPRFGMPEYKASHQDDVEVYFDSDVASSPLSKRSPTMYFVCSMTDLFGSWVENDWIDYIMCVAALCPQHVFQILTKRPERMAAYFREDSLHKYLGRAEEILDGKNLNESQIDAGWVWDGVPPSRGLRYRGQLLLPNVWCGCSVEDQKTYEDRWKHMLSFEPAVRWISAEPLLESIFLDTSDGSRPDWVVIGGESGPGARRYPVREAQGMVTACLAMSVPVFHKQMGANVYDLDATSSTVFDPDDCWPEGVEVDENDEKRVILKDSKGENPDEWPKSFRVRQFPASFMSEGAGGAESDFGGEFRVGELYLGDCLDVMKGWPDDCVDLVLGSGPYEDARDYGEDFNLKGQEFVDWMFERMVEMLRVSRGLVAMVLNGKTRNGQYSFVAEWLAMGLQDHGYTVPKPAVFQRYGIPQSSWLRDIQETIVCATKNWPLPYANYKIGGPQKHKSGGNFSYRTKDGTRVEGKEYPQVEQTWLTNVISGTVGKGHMGSDLAHDNEAPFPNWLIEPLITCFCPEGGTVLDPFCGSGTTLAVAKKLGREYAGIELRESQIELTQKRIREVEDAAPSR